MSTPHPRLDALFAALSAHIGISGMALNEDHVCRLVLDKTLVIDLEYLPGTDTLQVYSVVGPHPGNHAGLCCRMLSANLFGQGTGGAVLALDEQRGEVLLVHTFDLATVPAEKFVSTLDAFVGYIEAWTAELRDAEDEDPDEDATTPASESGSGFIRV